MAAKEASVVHESAGAASEASGTASPPDRRECLDVYRCRCIIVLLLNSMDISHFHMTTLKK